MTPQDILPTTALDILCDALSLKAPTSISEPLRVPWCMSDDFYRRALLIIFDEMLEGTGDPLAAARRAAQWWNAAVRLGPWIPDVIERHFGHVAIEHRLNLAYTLFKDAPRQVDLAATAIGALDYPSGTKTFGVSRATRALERGRAVGLAVEGVRSAFERGEPISLGAAQEKIWKSFAKRSKSKEAQSIGRKVIFQKVFASLRSVLHLCEGTAQAISAIEKSSCDKQAWQLAFGFAADSYDRLAAVRLKQSENNILFDGASGLRLKMEPFDGRVEAAVAALKRTRSFGTDGDPAM